MEKLTAVATLDLTPAVWRQAGVGRYTHELATALSAAGNTVNGVFCPASDGKSLPVIPSHPLPFRPRIWRGIAALSQWGRQPQDQLLPPGVLFHATDHTLPYLNRPSVLTLFDLTPLTHPHFHLPLNRYYSQVMLPLFALHAQAIVCISEHTRQIATQRWPTLAHKMSVTPLGINRSFHPITDPMRLAAMRSTYNLPEAYILTLCTLEPRKNLCGLLDAYATLRARRDLPMLVLAGKAGWKHQSLYQRIHTLGLSDVVHFTGWVSDNDLPALLSGAQAFIYPSFYEGFGLPPLEALACGTPVICSNTSSLPEVVGQAALMINPYRFDELARAIDRLLTESDLRDELHWRGPRQAAFFTWERTARATLAVYKTIQKSK